MSMAVLRNGHGQAMDFRGHTHAVLSHYRNRCDPRSSDSHCWIAYATAFKETNEEPYGVLSMAPC